MSEWRPIEEAPKDGTPVLLYSQTRNYGQNGPSYFDDYSVAQWDNFTLTAQGWCGIVCGNLAEDREGIPYEHENPTHWMPLPPPPKVPT